MKDSIRISEHTIRHNLNAYRRQLAAKQAARCGVFAITVIVILASLL